MLQIIGWLLCLYLIVKACELIAMDKDKDKFARPVASIGAVLALLGAVGFFFMINVQAEASQNPLGQLGSGYGGSATPDAVGSSRNASSAEIDAAADQALKDADAAIKNASEALEAAGNSFK